MHSVGGHGRMILFSLQRLLERNPIPGISKHLHLTVVRLGSVEQFETPDMPQVARTFEQLISMLNNDVDTAALVASGQLRRLA